MPPTHSAIASTAAVAASTAACSIAVLLLLCLSYLSLAFFKLSHRLSLL